MQRLAILLLQFNKPLWICHLLFSGFGLCFVIINGMGFVLISFSLKLAGYIGAVLYQNYFTSQIFFYYRNAGVTIRKLYLCSFAADLLCYLLIVGFYQFYIAAHAKG